MSYYNEFYGEKKQTGTTQNLTAVFCLIAYVLTFIYMLIWHQDSTLLETHIGGCLIAFATAFARMGFHLKHALGAMLTILFVAFIPVLISVL